MDTFLTPLPAPPPVFAPTDAEDDDFSSIVALLAMHADLAAPQPAASDFFFLRDDSAQGAAVCVGLPGSPSDTPVLARSALCARCGDTGRLVGGSSYPLTEWMLVPYAHRNLTWAQHAFNERLAAARGAAHGAVRRLRAGGAACSDEPRSGCRTSPA